MVPFSNYRTKYTTKVRPRFFKSQHKTIFINMGKITLGPYAEAECPDTPPAAIMISSRRMNTSHSRGTRIQLNMLILSVFSDFSFRF